MSDAYRLARRAKQDWQFSMCQAAYDNADDGQSVFDPDDMRREAAAIEISRDPELMAEAMRETADKAQLIRYAKAELHGTKYERAAARDAIAESYVDSYLKQQESRV